MTLLIVVRNCRGQSKEKDEGALSRAAGITNKLLVHTLCSSVWERMFSQRTVVGVHGDRKITDLGYIRARE